MKAFLIETYKVDEGRLSVIGFGEEQLKNKDDPLADENRRVQIVNTGSATVAEGKPAEAAPEPAAPEQEAAPAEAAPEQDAAPPARGGALRLSEPHTFGAPATGKRCLMRRNRPSRTPR